MPAIVIINQTTLLEDSEIPPVILALQTQLSRDLMKYWGHSAWLAFAGRGKPIPKACWQLILKDESDVEGALGYHDRTDDLQPIGYCFIKTDIDNGTSWTVTLSHELLELVIDPWTVFTAEGRVKGKPVFRALEVSDPCEDESQGYDIGTIRVSDFVTPKYFQDESIVGPYDFCGLIKHPGELLINGYQSIFINGKWTDILASKAPDYKNPVPGNRRWLRQHRHDLRKN